jgi:hypothetical protein
MRALFIACLLVLLAACGDDVQVFEDARPVDAAAVDASDTDPGPDASCFTNPTTHVELINACTTSEKLYKTPNLPLNLPDGGLAPIP